MKSTIIPTSTIKQAFYNSTEKSHVVACWVGIALNMMWFISDYLIIKEFWLTFFVFRLSVSLISISVLVFRKNFRLNIYLCMFILVLGISVQNAYMWSVMDISHFQKHAFAYMVLFIGAGMLVLWDFMLSILLIVATIISNVIFYIINSPLTVEEFLINGGLLTLTVAIFCMFLIRTRYRLTITEIKSRLELEHSKKLIEEKQKEILDSIHYAKRIQSAVITPHGDIARYLSDFFILHLPKDIVSGDFYWATEKNGKFYLAVCDSTGHGVPGSFMSLLNIGFLNEAIMEKGIEMPNDIFTYVRTRLIDSISKDGQKDGFDGILLCFDTLRHTITYAAAHNAPIAMINETLTILPHDKMPVGKGEKDEPFKLYTLPVKTGDCIYLFTDGYVDQFGGPKGKKFKRKQLEALFLKQHPFKPEIQKDALKKAFDDWKGDLEQVDDVLVVGLKLV